MMPMIILTMTGMIPLRFNADDNLSLEVPSGKSSSNTGDWNPTSHDFRLASSSAQRLSAASDTTKMTLYERANTGMEELIKYLKVCITVTM